MYATQEPTVPVWGCSAPAPKCRNQLSLEVWGTPRWHGGTGTLHSHSPDSIGHLFFEGPRGLYRHQEAADN